MAGLGAHTRSVPSATGVPDDAPNMPHLQQGLLDEE